MQRVYAMSAGYEDVNDHDRLRNDSLLATICGKEDPEGKGTEFARLQCESIRVKLLKIGAQVSARRVYMSLASGYPYQGVFLKILENIKRVRSLLC
jgi:hypothetical protein